MSINSRTSSLCEFTKKIHLDAKQMAILNGNKLWQLFTRNGVRRQAKSPLWLAFVMPAAEKFESLADGGKTSIL